MSFRNHLVPPEESCYRITNRRGDPRIADVVIINPPQLKQHDVALIGFPEERGVVRNNGRAGTAQAPTRIRMSLGRLVATAALTKGSGRFVDLGDIAPASTLEEAQALLGQVVAGVLLAGAIPVLIGGGHESAYGHFLGYVDAGEAPVTVFNVDSHLDLRPLLPEGGHSGSSFRQILEHPSARARGYCCYGVQRAVNAESLFEYALGRRVQWAELGGDESLWDFFVAATGSAEKVMVSVDLDAVAQAEAPGVSAPSPIGLPSEELIAFARRAAALPYVTSLEICECCPPLDRDDQTARLAARVVWEFLCGKIQSREKI